jgi:hypothetical protein
VPLLVLAIEALELGEHLRVGVGALLGRRAGGELLRADGRVRVEDLEPLAWGQVSRCHTTRLSERILEFREQFHESGATLEELGELVDAQLPR